MTRGRARNCFGSWKKSESTSCFSFVSSRLRSRILVGFSGMLLTKETLLLTVGRLAFVVGLFVFIVAVNVIVTGEW